MYGPLLGPFVYARIVEAGTLRRHLSRCGPGGFLHPIAVANLSNILKLSTGDVEPLAPDSMMPARNGGARSGSRRVMAIETDKDPADWPCNIKVSYRVMPRISWGPHAP